MERFFGRLLVAEERSNDARGVLCFRFHSCEPMIKYDVAVPYHTQAS